MSNRKNEIETLKIIFEKAKNEKRDETGGIEDLDFHMDVWGALTVTGKENYIELKDELLPYLNDPFPEFRAEAVKSLGWNTRLALPEFKEKAYEIWHNDPDDDVRVAALAAISDYYSKSRDVKMLKEFYEILISKKYSMRMRTYALDSIMEVSGAYTDARQGYAILALCELTDEQEFNNSVDWENVHNIMRNCIPNWKPNFQ